MRPDVGPRLAAFLPMLLLLALLPLGGCDALPVKPLSDNGLAALPADLRREVEAFAHGLGAELILCRAADLNADGTEDVVIILAPAKGTAPVPGHEGNVLCVLVAGPQGYKPSNFLPAPHERQRIEIKDIDGKPPLEFVVSGAKGPKTGLGVYRLNGLVLENLFGESMSDCC